MTMHKRHRRLFFILFVMACLAGAAGLSLYALRDNVTLFFSPREVQEKLAAADTVVSGGRVFRLGGLVKAGSLEKRDGDLSVSFTVTDNANEVNVVYKGILPDLFREGQGVVARGRLDAEGVFQADELLAKHDENYMPPEVAKALKKSHDAATGAAEEDVLR